MTRTHRHWSATVFKLAVIIGNLAICLLAASSADLMAQGAFHRDDEWLLRAELERIVREEPEQAQQARRALEALDKPEDTPDGRAIRNRAAHRARRIVNGLPARGYAAVGALLVGADPASARAWCTGTLVGCDKFLTAAHCIEKNPSPSGYTVFFQEFGFFRVRDIKWPKDSYKFPFADLAMITLDRVVEGVAPLSINATAKPLTNQLATIVGFGRSGGARRDYGIKRVGSAKISSCPTNLSSKKVLCWTFDADIAASSKQSNTCNGDSGGGVLIADREGSRVVQKIFGVVSGGRDENCVKNDVSYNVDVREFSSWIKDAGEGKLSSEFCGGTKKPTRSSVYKHAISRLSVSSPEMAISILVPPAVQNLRVALNGEDDGLSNFDLLVFRGKNRTGQLACRQDGSGQFAFCDIQSPEPGEWTAVAKRQSGEGQVQMVASFRSRN